MTDFDPTILIEPGVYLVVTKHILTAGMDMRAVRIYQHKNKKNKLEMKSFLYNQKIIKISKEPVFKKLKEDE